MVHIDLDADLNFVDDEGFNIARLHEGRADIVPLTVLVAGRPGAWSWALVEKVEEGFVYFVQVTAAEARQLREPTAG